MNNQDEAVDNVHTGDAVDYIALFDVCVVPVRDRYVSHVACDIPACQASILTTVIPT